MAGRIALDLKRFKHLKSDDKTHTLQHEDGHTLTLATKALGKENQAQLAALSKAANSSKNPTDKSEDVQDKQVRGMADGGDVQDAQPQSAIGKQIQRDEMTRAQDPMRGIDPNAQIKQVPQPAYNSNPMSPENIAYGDQQAKQFKDKMGSVMYEPTVGDYVGSAMGEGMTHQEMMDKAQNLAMAGTMAKVPGGSGQGIKAIPAATRAFPTRGAGQGVGLIDTAQKGLGSLRGPSAPVAPKLGKVKGTVYAGGGEVREYNEGTTDVEPQVPAALAPSDPIPADPVANMTNVPTSIVKPDAGSAEQDTKIRNENLMNIYNSMTPPDRPEFRFKNGEVPKEGIDPDQWEQSRQIFESKIAGAEADTEKQAAERAKQASRQSRQANIMQELGKVSQPPPPTVPSVPAAPSPGQVVGQQLAPQAQGQQPQPQGQQPQPQAPGQGTGVDKNGVYQASPHDTEGLYSASVKNLIGAEKTKYTAAKQLAEDQQKDLDTAVLAKNTALANLRSETAENQRERAALQQDIKDGYVDPEKYWTGDSKGNGSHSRILSAIGMIIAGFNPTSNPNAAINFLQKQMDMNLEAQKENLNSKQNLLRANLDNYKNIRDAADMTRLQQNDYVESQLKAHANKATTPLSQAALMGAIGTIQKDSMKTAMDLDLRRGLMKMSQNPGSLPQGTIGHSIAMMGVMNHPQYKDYLDRYFPAVNGKEQLAGRPTSAKDREAVDSHVDFDKALTNLQQFVKTHNTWVPGTGNYTEGDVMAKELQTLVRERLMNTVYREGEQPLLDAIVKSNPAGFRKWITESQLSTLKNVNNRKFDTLKQSLGGTFLQSPSSSVPPHPREGQTGMLNGQRIRIVNGQPEPVR